MRIRFLLLVCVVACVVLGVGIAGCSVKTDLGTDCFLVKKGDGGEGVRMLESEIKANRDFISFGATECEDLVCVRDSQYDAGPDPTAFAKGYCSKPCIPQSSVGCPAQNSDDDQSTARRLSCRALLLDEDTLTAICNTEPQKCEQYFGNTKKPYFCARGSGDAGP